MSSDNCQAADELNMSPINKLPEEILWRIMSLLHLTDRKNTRLVCKQWHRISYDKRLVKEDWTKIVASEYLNHTSTASRHPNVRVGKNPDLTMESLPFWEKHGREIEAIEFQCIQSDNQALPSVLRLCPNAKCMNILFMEPLAPNIYFPGLPSRQMKSEETDTFRALFPQTLKLKELWYEITGWDDQSPTVMELIKRQSDTLEGLGLMISTNVTHLGQILEIVGRQLRRLYFVSNYLTDSGLRDIVRKFDHLEHLSLAFTRSRLSFSTLEDAMTSLKNLTHLSLRGIMLNWAFPSFFMAINNMKQLIAIDLLDTKINATMVLIAFSSPHPKLTNLRTDCFEMDATNSSDFLNELCPRLPNLLGLWLGSCYLTDKAIQAIARYNTRLEELSITQSSVANFSAINGIKTLMHLSLNESIENAAAGTVRALSLSELHTINLTRTRTNSADILQLVKLNRSLHQVEMEMWPPLCHDAISKEIFNILESRKPNRPCRPHKDIFF